MGLQINTNSIGNVMSETYKKSDLPLFSTQRQYIKNTKIL